MAQQAVASLVLQDGKPNEGNTHVDTLEEAIEILSGAQHYSFAQNTELLGQAPVPQVRPSYTTCTAWLRSILIRRYEIAKSVDDLNRVISVVETTLPFLAAGHRERQNFMVLYGDFIGKRFDETGALDDLNLLIKVSGQALTASSADDERLKYLLSNALGNAFWRRYERQGSINDLCQAIETLERAVATVPQNHPDRATCLPSLAMALGGRYERNGAANDLDRAISFMEEAISLLPQDDINRPVHLVDLSTLLRMRGERTWFMVDLEASITAAKDSLASANSDHPRRSFMLLGLGIALALRFFRAGSSDDIDESIRLLEEAAEMTSKNPLNHALILANLGNACNWRYQRTGSMDDLNRAIEVKERASSIISQTNPQRGTILSNLALAFRERYVRQKSVKDLLTSLILADDAIKCVPRDHPQRGKYCNNMAMLWENVFDITKSTDKLNRAIAMYNAALSCTSANHPDRSQIRSNLGASLLLQFQQAKSTVTEDLDVAITMLEEALSLRPKNDPYTVLSLMHLAKALSYRFEQRRSQNDLERALEILEASISLTASAPLIRLRAITQMLPFLIGIQDKNRACKILRSAVQLLPAVSPRALTRSDQQFNIAEFTDITSHAVSLSLACDDDPFIALQLLELGKGVLANLQLEVRSDISVLTELYPDIAKEFNAIRDQLDSPESWDASNTERRRDQCKQFNLLLSNIRGLSPDLENFLLAPSKTMLKSISAQGTIIVFNVSHLRADAFIVNTDNIRSIQLPLSIDALASSASQFLTATDDYYRHSDIRTAIQSMNTVLQWLWDHAVGIVLDDLGFVTTPAPNTQWPRVWWVGSGLLNLMPIHAAGYHDDSPLSFRTAIDRVVSSYTPTIKALAYARERATQSEKQEQQAVLLVGMPNTPELPQSALPFVEKEISGLKTLLPCSTVLQHPSRETVLANLDKHDIVHFACHGYTAADPSQSGLLLHDWKTAPLTVSDFTLSSVRSASFAYLSACHTSRTGDLKLLDESISLSSAIQLSGYHSVVGSLWQIADSQSAVVAKDLYTGMLAGGTRLNIRQSADSLHRAVRASRERTRSGRFGRKLPQNPLVWGPYIHIGV